MVVPYELIIIAAAVLPCLAFIVAVDRYDRFKKEPRHLLLKLFGFGLLTPLAAALIEQIVLPLCGFLPETLVIPAEAFLGIAVPEEAVKLAVLVFVVRRRKEFDELLDGALYGVTVSMAFAVLENFLYVFGADEPMSVALVRGLTAVPLHALAGGFMGLAVARYRVESRGSVGSGFIIAVGIHGAYDWALMDPRLPSALIAPILLGGWLVLAGALKKARRDDCLAGRHFPN